MVLAREERINWLHGTSVGWRRDVVEQTCSFLIIIMTSPDHLLVRLALFRGGCKVLANSRGG